MCIQAFRLFKLKLEYAAGEEKQVITHISYISQHNNYTYNYLFLTEVKVEQGIMTRQKWQKNFMNTSLSLKIKNSIKERLIQENYQKIH